MERYFICGWAINDANFIVPVVGQVSNQPNVEVSDLFYDNAPNDPMVVYGIGVRVKSLADDEEKLMEFLLNHSYSLDESFFHTPDKPVLPYN